MPLEVVKLRKMNSVKDLEKFLKENYRISYTGTDLSKFIYGDRSTIYAELNRLWRKGVLAKKKLGREVYYFYREEFL